MSLAMDADLLRVSGRTAWPADFPEAIVHAKWRTEGRGVSLAGHPRYEQAKRFGDARAANEIVEFLLDEESIYGLGDLVNPRKRTQTYVIAPARTFENPSNLIPHVFAKIIANELELRVCQSIYQYDGIKRDRRGFWQRFANPVSFRGNIPRDGDYILVDDVITTGGTLASLRGFIENHGCRVICMSGLSAPGGANLKVALDPLTIVGLKSLHGGRMAPLIVSETGYAIEHLTEPEATKLLGARSLNEVRQKIFRARNQIGVDESNGSDGRAGP